MALVLHLNADRGKEPKKLISVDDRDVPRWQRAAVWKDEEMGLLAYSILRGYPTGQIVLWKLPSGIRVPIDGRQRLTAIREFARGQVAIPDYPGIPEEYRNRKLLVPKGEEEEFEPLSLEDQVAFNSYGPEIVEYDDIDEQTAMDIFVKLQGGKPLTKAEVRGALGGRLCDFVGELTDESRALVEEEDEEAVDPARQHPFFRRLGVPRSRKRLRGVCDLLVHEHLYPGTSKHWSALEAMYFEKASTLTDREKDAFRAELTRFYKAIRTGTGADEQPIPELRHEHLILTTFQIWRDFTTEHAVPKGFDFASAISNFEAGRAANPDDQPWVKFTADLSNAGYSADKMAGRYRVLMPFILNAAGDPPLKDPKRAFSEGQKITIWNNAGKRCQGEDAGVRCAERFPDFREADADHFVKWSEGGPTSVENGRLLCRRHNRGGANAAHGPASRPAARPG